ncbi:N-methylproline demethylase, partial [Mesorhizobium sp. M1233]
MTSNDPLLQPYQLKHLTLKNRVMSTSHEPAYSEDGMPKERYRLYHAEKAKGGMALTMTAGSAIVSRDSPAAFGNLHVYDDRIVPWLAELTGACHEHDCKVMIQITHLGRRTGWNKADWLPVLSASPVREPAHRAFPKTIEDWDIERIVADYAAAAQRCQAAGLDGIEFEAYGHLMDGFWSPATNRRDDDFGGSLDNRLRFTGMVLDAVRAAVGEKFVVGIRMVADEDFEKGLSKQEGVEIARRLAGSGKVDFLNIIRGSIETDAALTKVIPVTGMRSSPHLDFAGEVRAATKFPTFHAARISDVATARHAIATGKLDMVGMTRAHIADPHIVKKVMEGREHEIRPCVGATYCLDRIYEGGEALCIHNAATGREADIPHIIPKTEGPKRKVVVLGARARREARPRLDPPPRRQGAVLASNSHAPRPQPQA